MPIVGKFFPSQKSQEKVFLLLRRHWFTYFGFVFVAFIMSIPILALIIFWINRPDYFSSELGSAVIIAVFSYILFALGVMLYGFIDYYLDVYIVTNERIVDVEQNGFFKRKISELHLHQIQDVSAKVEGIFPTMLHYGNILIQTAGERENFVFQSIPNPYRVSKLIADLHEAQIQERMLETEAKVIKNTDESTADNAADRVLDAEITNPMLLSEVRNKTKEFLKADSNGEEIIKTEIENNIFKDQGDKMLKNINNNHQEKVDQNNKITASKNAKNLNSKKSKKSEGEMHENEQIDI